MVAIGRAWIDKTLEIRHEHFASTCLSDFLREAREPFDHQARGPRVAAAMFPGDEHEGGLLMACVLMAYRGHRVVYLGPNTPVEQIAAAATRGLFYYTVTKGAGLSPYNEFVCYSKRNHPFFS